MRWLWTLAVCLAVVAAAPALAGYDNLRRDFDSWKPPAYAVIPPPALPVPASAKEDDFARGIKGLEEKKNGWETAIGAATTKDSFYFPDPDVLKKLGPATVNDAAAADSLADGFTLETLEALALLRSPVVSSSQRSFRAALEGYSQVANLDEMLRAYSAFTGALMTTAGGMNESPAMRFPFPAATALKGEVVTQEVLAAREELEMARKEAVTEARRLYWELLYIRRASEITGRSLDLMRELADSTTLRYEVGEGGLREVTGARIESGKMREELTSIAGEQANLEAGVRKLLALPPEVKVGAPAAREPSRDVPPLEPLYPLAREKSPEIKAQRAMVGRMEKMIEMSKLEINPRFTQDLSTFDNRAVLQAGSGRMEEPFPDSAPAAKSDGAPAKAWYGSGLAYLRESEQRLAALREELRRTEAGVLDEVRESWFRLDRARREEILYSQRIGELSRLSRETALGRYRSGDMTLTDVLEAFRSALDNELAAARRAADLGVARAELESAVGAAW